MSQAERLMYIRNCLANEGKITVLQICQRFEICVRQATRDIEYLRNRLDCTITYCRKIKAYKPEGPVPELSPTRDLLDYTFLLGVMKSYNLLPLQSDQIEKVASERLDDEHRELARAIVYRFSQAQVFDTTILDIALQACKIQKACTINYSKPGDEKRHRDIEPYRFVNYDGQWYIIAHCRVSGDLRQFVLSRIYNIRLTDSSFTSGRSSSELDTYCEHSFGIMRRTGIQPVTVTIRFTGKSADIVSTQHWHPGQAMERNEKARETLLSLSVDSYEEIVRKVLFFGAEAEAVSPPDFRELWLSHIAEMHKKFMG